MAQSSRNGYLGIEVGRITFSNFSKIIAFGQDSIKREQLHRYKSMILFYVTTAVISFFGLVLGYFLLTLLGMLIPMNRNFKKITNGINIGISTNGMHTDFILPIKNEIFDWTKIIDMANYDLSINSDTKLGIGWGDKAIYLDIETWGELTLKMGLATLFLPTPTILHVTAYKQLPTETLKVRYTSVSASQYLQLCHYISAYFKMDGQQKVQLIENAGYMPNDNFYHAIGKYHAFQTCNTWVNKGLRQVGIKTALWSPLDKGIFYQFEKI